MSETETINVELEPHTAKMLRAWYKFTKDRLCFDNFSEFLLYMVRKGMTPHLTGPGSKKILKLLEEEVAEE